MNQVIPILFLVLAIVGCDTSDEPREGAGDDSGNSSDQSMAVDGGITMDGGAVVDAEVLDEGVMHDAIPLIDMMPLDMMPMPMPMPEPTSEHAFMMVIPASDADWRDLAYLSAVVASGHVNADRPVVIALNSPVSLGASAADFLERFSPQEVTIFGAPDLTVEGNRVNHHPMDNLETVTLTLAATWQRSDEVVLVSSAHYGNALLAASFAGRIGAPLFFIDEAISPALTEEFARLGATQAFVIGDGSASELDNVTYFDGPDAVLSWLMNNGYELDYLAVVNPNDRSLGRSQKLSLTAPKYTTRRKGLVIPIETDIPADVADGTALAEVLSQLNARYETMGRHPEHLALVGSFDVVPIERRPSLFDVPEREWPLTDIPYGERDADPFREIAVGRIFTDSIYRGSLLAARTVTYELLMDGHWEQRFVETGLWGFDELRAIMLNVGFDAPQHLSEAEIDQRPSLEVSAILHKDHSHCTVLGHAFTVQTQTLYAPAVVLSRGCSVAGIDLVGNRTATVPGNMLGRGAIAFVGAPRNSIAGNTVTEVAFFNYMLEGKTLGQAMRAAFNNATVHYLDENRDAGMRYVLENEMLFGDPGLVFHVPDDPITSTATATLNDEIMTVKGPEEWTLVQFVPEQLAEWNYEGDLFMYVGPGAEPKTYWSGGHDREDLYYTVALPVPGDTPTSTLTQLEMSQDPLGWRGNHYLDTHQDGSHTLRLRVRLLDYNMQTGEIMGRLDEARFRLSQ